MLLSLVLEARQRPGRLFHPCRAGNQTDIGFTDHLRYLGEGPRTPGRDALRDTRRRTLPAGGARSTQSSPWWCKSGSPNRVPRPPAPTPAHWRAATLMTVDLLRQVGERGARPRTTCCRCRGAPACCRRHRASASRWSPRRRRSGDHRLGPARRGRARACRAQRHHQAAPSARSFFPQASLVNPVDSGGHRRQPGAAGDLHGDRCRG